MEIYKTVVGNNSPDLAITAKRNGTAINVTGATVTLIVTNERTGAVTNAGSACTLTTPTSGIVTYSPVAGDYPSEGRYIGELKIVHSGGKIERINEVLLIIARAATN